MSLPMHRLLRDIANGKETTGDTTTLVDYSVLGPKGLFLSGTWGNTKAPAS